MILLLVQPNTQDKMLQSEIADLLPDNIEIDVQEVWYPYQLTKKKSPPKVKDARKWAEDHIKFCDYDYILVCDATYFKALTKNTLKPEKEIGYIHTELGTNVLYCPSVNTIFYNPDLVRSKIKLVINTITNHLNGMNNLIGGSVIEHSKYPKTLSEIISCLTEIKDKTLTCDIETYSLKHWDAGIASISFATDEHSGIAFKVDISKTEPNKQLRLVLKGFFKDRWRLGVTTIWHNACFDCYVLTYILFMEEDMCNRAGLLQGLKVFLDNFEDTKLISYLATNNASGNHLSLKEQAYEFAGNWGLPEEKITDIANVDQDLLLSYNLTDSCATWYVYHKHYNNMLKDMQYGVYTALFKPACKDIINMQLIGMPLDMKQVLKVDTYLNQEKDRYEQIILASPYVSQTVFLLKQKEVMKRNKKLKTKQVTEKDISLDFCIGSGDQLAVLLYTVCDFEIKEYTRTGKPATGQDVIEDLLNTIEPEDDKYPLLDALVHWQKITKITNTFLKAMKEAPCDKNGQYWLCGKFNLGGTVSGRLSSSDPNLQNIPSGSTFAKLIKSCFRAPKGWLMVGLDFASLEDRISALTTKDVNKLRVYTDGFDGHCLRAYSYFKDKMPDIKEQMEEIEKEGKIYKVTHDDSSVEYLNEHNPKLQKYMNQV